MKRKFSQSFDEFVGTITNIHTPWLWGAFGMVILSIVFSVFLLFVLKDKPVRGYYLAREGNAGVEATCIRADVNWDADVISFCTTDTEKAVRLVKELNQTVQR